MSIRINGQVIASATDITDYSKKTGNETLSGVKTFSSSPIIPTPAYTDNSTNAANTEWIRNNIAPAGSVMIWAGTTVPTGYLLCDGSAVSRTTYSALFAAIGTTYGVGDGSSTFNLPNFQGRYLKQGTSGTYSNESLPNITGRIGNSTGGNVAIYMNAESKTDKSLYVAKISEYGMNNVGGNTETRQYSILLNASRSSSAYQDNAKVNPDNAEIMYCIKY